MGIFFSDWKCNLLALLILIISFVYVFLKRTFSYWDRKGFKTAPGCGSLFGHIESVLFGRESWSDLSLRLYKSTNDRFIGIYSGFRPALLIRDRELIKTILIKEFNTFPNRPLYNNPENDPISDHLLTSVDERWKNMRRILTPAFTGSKLREMFPIFVDCSSLIQKHLSKVTERGTQLNINELAAQYTISVIASVGFGLDVDAIDNADNHFFVMGRKIFEKTIWNGIRWMCIFLAPNLMPILRIRATAADVEEFFRSIAHQNLIHRERRNVIRKDVFQLLVQWRNEGMIHSDNRWNVQMKNGEHEKELTEAQVTAQMFIFFAAGYETSASAITFLMYELAKNAEIQQKLHDEIDEFIGEKNINEITFDLIRKLPYLDACSKGLLISLHCSFDLNELHFILFYFFLIHFKFIFRNSPKISDCTKHSKKMQSTLSNT